MIELRFTVVCHCPDTTFSTDAMNCFNDVVSAFDPDVLRHAHCDLTRLEDVSSGC